MSQKVPGPTGERLWCATVRRGVSLRRVARRFHVGVATVHRWVERAGQQRLDRAEWTDQPSVPRRTTRTRLALEERVLSVRRSLATGDLGQLGAVAIHRALQEEGLASLPCVRTIGRILERGGALDARRRVRRPPPPTRPLALLAGGGYFEIEG